MPKLLLILGPTAMGKTALGFFLSQKLGGEIISADSRQVYKYLNIGTGKESGPLPTWGIDLIDPDDSFNLSDFLDFARPKISELWESHKLPVVVGGTTLYLKSLVEPLSNVKIPPNQLLRRDLESASLQDLQLKLQEINHSKWQSLNHSDQNNPRRLIRALEVTLDNSQTTSADFPVDPFFIFLTAPKPLIYERIDARVDQRLERGLLEEIELLLSRGYDWTLPSFTASGYRQFQGYFAHQITLDQAVQNWKNAEHAYARRQLTFMTKFLAQQEELGRPILKLDIQNLQPEEIFSTVQQWYS